jgi:hypothetical protein
MQNSGPSWKLSTRKKYDQIMDAMVHIRTGDKMGEVWATYPQAYKWWKSYAPVNNGVGGFILVERPPDAFGLNQDDINVGVDSVVKLTYFEAAYSNIRKWLVACGTITLKFIGQSRVFLTNVCSDKLLVSAFCHFR